MAQNRSSTGADPRSQYARIRRAGLRPGREFSRLARPGRMEPRALRFSRAGEITSSNRRPLLRLSRPIGPHSSTLGISPICRTLSPGVTQGKHIDFPNTTHRHTTGHALRQNAEVFDRDRADFPPALRDLHQPNDVAPFAMTNYETIRPGRRDQNVLLSGQMPPCMSIRITANE